MGQSGDSELEDLAHERTLWKVQHFAWAFFGLVVLAALLGVFGNGLVSRASAGKPGTSLWIEYERFARYHAENTLKIHLGGSANNAIPAIWFSRAFFEKIEVTQVYPEPEQVRVGRDRMIYIFTLARTNEPVTISFCYKPAGYGSAPARLGLVGGPELQFSQFVYP